MKILRMMSWKLDDVLHLRDQPFTEDIETLPLHFESHHWETLYNNGRAIGTAFHGERSCIVLRIGKPLESILLAKTHQNQHLPPMKRLVMQIHQERKNCHSTEFPTAIEILLWQNGASSAGTESLCQSKM